MCPWTGTRDQTNTHRPSTMTAVTDGVCVSTLPNYRPSTACLRLVQDSDISTVTTDVTFLGAPTTVQLLTFVGSRSIMSTATTTFAPSQTADYVGVSIMPMVMLVRRESDASSPGGGSGGGGNTDGPPKPNAAGYGGVRATMAGVELSIMVCFSAFLVSSAFFLAI